MSSQKRWRDKNRDHTREYDKKRSQNPERKARIREYNKRYAQRMRQQIIDKLGEQCIICSGPKQHYHEIYGREHPTRKKYILENIDDFVSVCWQCHRGIHWLMAVSNKSWNEVYPILKSIV